MNQNLSLLQSSGVFLKECLCFACEAPSGSIIFQIVRVSVHIYIYTYIYIYL